MCGIAGLWAPETSVGPWFADATEIARHRGPDKDGWWVPGMAGPERLETLRQRPPETVDVALGFLALKILDLTPTGDQPMVRDDRATLTFNGEIYNYVEIREELRARGHTFRSTGDSEVLLRSYLEWGIDAIRRFDGMWAFGIYDHERQGLLLSRDRFGEKPLFWTPFGDGGVAFASEVKQLARFPAVELCLDAHRASAFVATGRPYDGSSSWFERIHQLEPGSWLWVDRDGIRTGRYFELRDEVAAVEPSSTPEAWSERFAEALTTSVMRRLRSDVPVGTSLSAGIDSSAIMAEATALGHTGYHSFTLGAEDSRLDERPEAQAFAGQMSSIWHGVNADGATFAAEWDRQTWHQEAPVASTSLFGQWKVMEAARAAGVVVMLDGQGSDEVLGGYHKFSAAHVLRTIQDRPWAAPLESVRFLRQLGGIATITRDGYRYLPGRTTSAPDVASLLRIAPPVERAPSIRTSALTMRVADIERWSLPNLLTYADRNAMAHSIETRLPYLAPDLAVLGLAMPSEVLVHDGWTKWPLRKALAAKGGQIPAWRRGKRWFGVPQAAWLDGPLAAEVRTWRATPHPLWEAFADPGGLRSFATDWDAHRGAAAWDDQVFSMVSLDRFLRTFFPV